MKGFMRLALLLLSALPPAWAGAPGGEEIVRRSLDNFYSMGNDMRVRVAMRLINAQGQVREREMTMLRLDTGAGGEQRYGIYFHAPGDIKGTAFLVWKYPAREDDRWIYVPALKLVKRIAADDKRSSFVGSDFTYEDVSGRDAEDETHTLVRDEVLAGRPVHVVESRPKATLDYARRLSWIDRERWLPLKEEYLNERGEVIRVFTADRVEEQDHHWTVTARSMKNMQNGHHTEVVFKEIRYDVGLKPELFTERHLRDAPAQWVK